MAVAGFNYAILHPTVWVAKLDPVTGRGPVWPNRTALKTNPVTMQNNGWVRWWGMQDGLTYNINDPQADIGTSDRGILGRVSTGAHGISVASQSKTFKLDVLDWFTKQAKRTLSAVGGTANVRTLTVTGTATASGNATLVLNGEVYTVSIASGDTAAVAAGKIRTAGNYTPSLQGWNLSGATADVIYTAQTPGARSGTYSVAMPAGLGGSFANTTPGVDPTSSAGEVSYFDPNSEQGSVQGFTLCIEGIAPAGSFADNALYMRTIIHQLSQGGTTGLRWDDSGNNAPAQLNLAATAQPRQVSALEMLGTGFDYTTDQDPFGKATTFRAVMG